MFNESLFNIKSIIIDMGTANTKFGWSGDEQPTQSIKSISGQIKYSKILWDQTVQKVYNPQGP